MQICYQWEALIPWPWTLQSTLQQEQGQVRDKNKIYIYSFYGWMFLSFQNQNVLGVGGFKPFQAQGERESVWRNEITGAASYNR